MKRALLSGITGQVGSYLAELLLDEGYEVHGLIRKSSTFPTARIDHLLDRLTLHYGDLNDTLALVALLDQVEPDEVYNLAAQSHVQVSFGLPMMTGQVTGLAVTAWLEALRIAGAPTRFYQASSSELFGNEPAPQNENTRISPRSPYAAAKAYAYHMTRIYREAYGLFAVNGILNNQESPRRSPTFVTRKITQAVARIQAGRQDTLALGNLDAERDWTFAGDGARAIWMMMQHEIADDWVIASGHSRSVQEFLAWALHYAGVQGSPAQDEWRERHLRREDARYRRPLEVNKLCGDATKARTLLGWEPLVSFQKLVAMMVEHDLREARRQ